MDPMFEPRLAFFEFYEQKMFVEKTIIAFPLKIDVSCIPVNIILPYFTQRYFYSSLGKSPDNKYF